MTFEWERAQTFDYRMIIAGGLDGANVAAAIAALQPWGVDACSRLEAAPGKKDAARVRAFVEAARAALERKLVRL
jgi:phosphoribosylanthranilate isomerase